MSGSRTTDEALKKQKPSRKKKGTKKNKKRWCKGKEGREHSYELGLPTWAASGSYNAPHLTEWHCTIWNTVHRGQVWYCRHVMVCCKCGRQESYDGADCPDRPEDDGTIEFR